jgi:hypothetical protein
MSHVTPAEENVNTRLSRCGIDWLVLISFAPFVQIMISDSLIGALFMTSESSDQCFKTVGRPVLFFFSLYSLTGYPCDENIRRKNEREKKKEE